MEIISKKISELRHALSIIEFQDHLSSDDYENIDKINNEIKELEKQLTKGYCVKFENEWYLTDNITLCYSKEPTWFENENECIEILSKAHLNEKDKTNYEIIERGKYENMVCNL